MHQQRRSGPGQDAKLAGMVDGVVGEEWLGPSGQHHIGDVVAGDVVVEELGAGWGADQVCGWCISIHIWQGLA